METSDKLLGILSPVVRGMVGVKGIVGVTDNNGKLSQERGEREIIKINTYFN